MYNVLFHKAPTGNLLFNLLPNVTFYFAVETKMWILSAKHKQHAVMHLGTESSQENYLSIHDFNYCFLSSESCLEKNTDDLRVVLWPWIYHPQITDRFLLFLYIFCYR